jgi:hypothetical protein
VNHRLTLEITKVSVCSSRATCDVGEMAVRRICKIMCELVDQCEGKMGDPAQLHVYDLSQAGNCRLPEAIDGLKEIGPIQKGRYIAAGKVMANRTRFISPKTCKIQTIATHPHRIHARQITSTRCTMKLAIITFENQKDSEQPSAARIIPHTPSFIPCRFHLGRSGPRQVKKLVHRASRFRF